MIADIFYFLLTLSILVTFHEYGHYWVARRCGVKVLRFSVGFGQPLWRHQARNGTEFVVAAIPLGGYVKMLDEGEQAVAAEEQPQAFNRQSAGVRAAILAAGPLANFLLAILVYWLVFMLGVPGLKPFVGQVEPGSPAALAGLQPGELVVAVDGEPVVSRDQVNMALLNRLGDSGEIVIDSVPDGALDSVRYQLPIDSWLAGEQAPDPYTELGFHWWYPVIEPVVEEVLPGGPAEAAGVQAGDRIVRIDGQDILDWEQLGLALRDSYDRRVEMQVQRAGEEVTLFVNVERFVDEQGNTEGRIGVSARLPEMPADMQVLERAGPLGGLLKAIDKTGSVIVFTLDSLKKMVVGLISPTHLGGPVTIAKIASMSAQSGIGSYLQILALLSISLGIFNLLPIPVLDGGHLLIIAVQSLIGRPVPEKVLVWVQQAGLVLLLSIMCFAIYNDITRL